MPALLRTEPAVLLAPTKGKAAKPTEFGKLLKVHEAENQIVVDYEVYTQRATEPREFALPSIVAGPP